jgi:two-component system chemotaxis response regulator CheB
MRGRDIVVIGASAGGVETLARVVRDLPPGLPASIFIVCHFPAKSTSLLPEILSRNGPLLAQHARHGELIQPGQIYIAPPDYHLILQSGQMMLSHGPPEGKHRPAIDALFRSAARAYGTRVIAVVLTGSATDGVAGLLAVRAAGGLAVIQDPKEALVSALPDAAKEVAGADYIIPVSGLALLLSELVLQPLVNQPEKLAPRPDDEALVARDMLEQIHDRKQGEISVFTCPKCGGCLWQLPDQESPRFRCHLGHAYASEALVEEQSDKLEAALWVAVRTFREKSLLFRQIADSQLKKRNLESSKRFEEQARIAEEQANLIMRHFLAGANAVGSGSADSTALSLAVPIPAENVAAQRADPANKQDGQNE